MPLISALEEESFVEDPSPSQSQFAKSSEEERLPITDLEDQITNINVERKDKVRKRKKAKVRVQNIFLFSLAQLKI